ncbi:hypothetical protein [Streptomyces sp. MST-110588]|uniref:hypothetical protein n=1 Tax=Streptomyces sp. MST-110588 TaxID=2833628 RepID=UPI001F5D8426|nr:hypothetical protein [Streptomyces sp. MST-110588]UNO42893.1 hypothetical protein KGS77_29500 [Streptomyces sp. MST-110588]
MAGSFGAWDPGEPPDELCVNAWTGGPGPVAAPLGPGHRAWALGPVAGVKRLLRPGAVDPADYRDERVGWGLVLPDRDGLPHPALPEEAPEPVRALFAARPGARLLRLTRATPTTATLRDYAAGKDIAVIGSPRGTTPGALPSYLLIYGGPEAVPWRTQYLLARVAHVGRLHLTGTGLERYVSALLDGWSDSTARYDSPLVWSPDHSAQADEAQNHGTRNDGTPNHCGDQTDRNQAHRVQPSTAEAHTAETRGAEPHRAQPHRAETRRDQDITSLMRDAIAAPVAERLRADGEMPGSLFLDGRAGRASVAGLARALAELRPALVVTTSHGLTSPLHDPATLTARIGLPVDARGAYIDPRTLLTDWQPDGAIWYAHACCGAGADRRSVFDGLVAPDGPVGEVLAGVAALGSVVAPLPTALLSARRPARAFIGHVEPTFDWTLRSPWTGQHLTDELTSVLYGGLCGGEPVGLALDRITKGIAASALAHEEALHAYNASEHTERAGLRAALYHRLVAADRTAMVILGDPTAALPLPSLPLPPQQSWRF